MKQRLAVYMLLFISILLACDSERDKIPYEYVNIYISLNDPQYSDLNTIGNSIMITGGVKGIIVYRKSTDEITAFDRCCSYDPECGKVSLDDDGYTLTDTCCGSEFSLLIDAYPTKKPATLPLRQYRVYFNQTDNSIQITNY